MKRIVSVNYVLGRPLIPSDFLKRIVTLNFQRNLRIVINVILGTEERSAFIFGMAIRFQEMDNKALINSRLLKLLTSAEDFLTCRFSNNQAVLINQLRCLPR